VLRNLDGAPITPAAAKTLIQARFHVPDSIRDRTSKHRRASQRPAPVL
jgi:hypothetical protein